MLECIVRAVYDAAHVLESMFIFGRGRELIDELCRARVFFALDRTIADMPIFHWFDFADTGNATGCMHVSVEENCSAAEAERPTGVKWRRGGRHEFGLHDRGSPINKIFATGPNELLCPFYSPDALSRQHVRSQLSSDLRGDSDRIRTCFAEIN